ncbi:MAG TPA: hypothetical protein VGR22_04165 [Thermomicrobiales bacterium]|nr:hypothetical protein [Thermomicrobiales bacterium]
MAQQKRNAENVTGVSNVTYDLMSVLTNKLEGIAATEVYKQDAQGDQEALKAFEEMEERDRKDVERLRDLVATRLGK